MRNSLLPCKHRRARQVLGLNRLILRGVPQWGCVLPGHPCKGIGAF